MLSDQQTMALFDRFIFFPDAEMIGDPGDLGMKFEDVWCTAEDGVRIHGWYVPGRGAVSLLWFHGNAGNISHRLEQLRLLHDQVGANILMVDYRQYGRSQGVASEVGIYADARAALAYLTGRSDADNQICYFGQSLGSAVAIDLAAIHPPAGMILEAAFVSLREMAGTLVPDPLARLLPSGFDNLAKIGSVRCPLLFIHGNCDEIVPYSQGRRLFEAARPPKAFYTVRGAGHNDVYVVGGETYFRRIRDFITSDE